MVSIVEFLILVLVGKVQELVPVADKLQLAKLALGIGVLGHFLLPPQDPAGRTWRRGPFVWWAGFSVVLFATAPFSILLSNTVTFLALKYTSISLLLLLTARHLQSLRRLEPTTRAIVGFAICLGLAMLVAPQITIGDFGPPRITVGATFDPNDLALVLAMSIPFCFYWLWRGRLLGKSAALLALLLALYAIHRTGSRGGLVAAALAVALTLFVTQLGHGVRLFVFVGLLAGAAGATQTETFRLLLVGLQGQDYNTTAEDGRLEIWKRGVGYALSRPLTGVGAECFEIAEGTLSGRAGHLRGVRWSAAHNSFVQIAAETGLIGLALWCLMLASCLIELRRQRRRLQSWRDDCEVQRQLALIATVRNSLLAFLLGGFFLSAGYLPFLYLLVAYTIALAEATDRLANELEEDADDEYVTGAN